MDHLRTSDEGGARRLLAGALQGVAASALWSLVTLLAPLAVAGLAWWGAAACGAVEAFYGLIVAHPVATFVAVAAVFVAGVLCGMRLCVAALRVVEEDEAARRREEEARVAVLRRFIESPAEVRRVASRAYRDGSVIVPEDQWYSIERSKGYFLGSPQDIGVRVSITEELRGLLGSHPELLEREGPVRHGTVRRV